jgi:hypothetical protein
MDTLPEELHTVIINFLSINEKIKTWSINKYFKSLIKDRIINAHKLEYRLKLYNNMIYKTDKDLPYISLYETIYLNGIKILLYKERRLLKYYIGAKEKNKRCAGNCGRNRIGEILHSKRIEEKNIYRYNRRSIGYCKECIKS